MTNTGKNTTEFAKLVFGTGRSLRQVAKEIGVSPAYLSQCLHSVRQPSQRLLNMLNTLPYAREADQVGGGVKQVLDSRPLLPSRVPNLSCVNGVQVVGGSNPPSPTPCLMDVCRCRR